METTNGNNVKKYFLLPKSLYQQADKIGSELGINFSELLRNALENYILLKEKEKSDREIAEACKFYYNIDEDIASEWRAAEGKI